MQLGNKNFIQFCKSKNYRNMLDSKDMSNTNLEIDSNHPNYNPTTVVEVEDVHKSFGPIDVLRGISFPVYRGKTTVMLGPSGTGKSVLMKAMVGLYGTDKGAIRIDGEDICTMKERDLFRVRTKMGKLFQDGALFDSMSVYENIAFPLKRHTSKKEDEIRAIVAEKLRVVNLPGIEGKLPGQLSGGMRKRVGLARAIALDPEIVFFDEPNRGLDPVMSAAVDDLIIRTKESLGSSFFIISHDIEGAFKIADYIGMLYEGKLVEFGTCEEIRNSKNPFLRQFFERTTDGPMRVA